MNKIYLAGDKNRKRLIKEEQNMSSKSSMHQIKQKASGLGRGNMHTFYWVHMIDGHRTQNKGIYWSFTNEYDSQQPIMVGLDHSFVDIAWV